MPREVRFVETMTGAAGAEPLGLHDLRIAVDPTPGDDDGLAGAIRGGTVRHAGREYQVTGGRFVALAVDPAGGRRMRYELTAAGGAGDGGVRLTGVKTVTRRPWRWWVDTSRMHVTLTTARGTATGVVKLSMPAFVRQLTTFRGRVGDVVLFVVRFLARLVR